MKILILEISLWVRERLIISLIINMTHPASIIASIMKHKYDSKCISLMKMGKSFIKFGSTHWRHQSTFLKTDFSIHLNCRRVESSNRKA